MKLIEMIISLIFISKTDLFSVKIEIYYQKIRIITKNIGNHRLNNINDEVQLFYLVLKISSWQDIIILEILEIKNLLMIYADRNVQ